MRAVPLWWALAATMLLAPLMGGQVPVEAQPLPPGGLLAPLLMGAAPTTLHALIALPVLAALAALLLRIRVVQLPAARYTVVLMLFVGALLATSFGTAYRAATLAALAEWMVYVAAFFGAIALSGRGQGPRIVATAFVAGCTLLALKGLVEYGQMRPIDPSWRIFAGWVNANALAGMLLLALPVALALACTAAKRLEALVLGMGSALICLALLLTQSKGGLLAAALGVGAFGLLASVRVERAHRRAMLGRLIAVLGCAAVLGVLLVASQKPTPAPSAPAAGSQVLGRVVDGGTEAQSFTFRKNLWTGAAKQVANNPLGTGLGTYRFHSARTGLTPQTHFAHQTYLQLAAEASPVAVVLLLLFAGMWLWDALRRDPGLPHGQKILRLGIVAAVVAGGAHNLVDSDLYHFGIGVAFFALMGLGVQLSSDAVTPEYLQPRWRAMAGASMASLLLWLAYSALGELAVGRLAGAVVARDPQAARAALEGAKRWAAHDGDTWRFAALLEPDAGKRADLAALAEQQSPSPRTARALARALEEAGKPAESQAALGRALLLDANNLLALRQRMELRLKHGDRSGALDDAKRLVAVEATPYYQVRALPEIVPTETFAARRLLAESAPPEEAVTLLAGAVAGMQMYATRTIPMLKQHVQSGIADGSRLDEAAAELEVAASDAKRLAEIYRSLGRTAEAAEADTSAAGLAAAAADLRSR